MNVDSLGLVGVFLRYYLNDWPRPWMVLTAGGFLQRFWL